MKKSLLLLIAPLLLVACSQKQAAVPTVKDSLPATTVAVNTSADLPSVVSIDDEWNEYKNPSLDLSIRFPKKVLKDGAWVDGTENATTEVHVIQEGELITFSRDDNPTAGYADFDGNTPYVQTDRTIRRPYFNPQYLNDPAYPYQIYVGRAENIEDVQAFMQRAYGAGCTVSEEQGSRYEDRPNVVTFTVGPQGTECPGYYPVGDIVTWYQDKNVVVGVQPGWGGKFTKPYAVQNGEPANYEVEAALLNE